MNLLRHLRDLAFEKQLKKDIANNEREHRQFNVDDVSSIGVLYHLTNEETDKMVNEFVDELKGKSRKVQVLGLYKDNYIPNYYIQKLTWFMLSPKTVNWYNKPIAPFAKSFCEEEFDLLIDLTLEDYNPLIYAGALSKAHFKAGRYTERNAKYYDLMIHSEQVETFPEFIQHVRHYISKVNR